MRAARTRQGWLAGRASYWEARGPHHSFTPAMSMLSIDMVSFAGLWRYNYREREGVLIVMVSGRAYFYRAISCSASSIFGIPLRMA